MDTSRRGTDWKPVSLVSELNKKAEKPAQVTQGVLTIISTLESPNITVEIIDPPTPTRANKKRGRKHLPLPEDLIVRLTYHSIARHNRLNLFH